MNSIKQEIINAIVSQTGLPQDYVSAGLQRSARPELGDYSMACFRLAKEQKKSPQELALELTSTIKPGGLIERVQAIAGYVNIFLDGSKLPELVLDKGVQIENIGNGCTIVIDYSSPNIAKPFGIGHLRSTVIGNALYKIYSALGYKCIGLNYLGDWGTQFGHIMDGIERERGIKLDALNDRQVDEIANVNIKELNKFYAVSAASEELSARENARAIFKKLEQGNRNIQKLWQVFRERSINEFERIYQMLDVHFDLYQGEAFYSQFVAGTIEEIEKKGLAQISEGALIVDLKEYGMPPCLLRKQDGSMLYAARDIASAIHRYHTYKFHKLIYVVGADQKLYFRQLFKVLELMGYDWAKDCSHVDFGLVRFKSEEGRQKMSTRQGVTVLLEEVLNEAINRSAQIMQEREQTGEPAIPRAVGIGAIIFNDLKNKRIKDVDFDWAQILSFDGETGPYLQYTHTRLGSLIKKYEETHKSELKPDYKLLNKPEEIAIIKMLNDFQDIILQSAEENEPSILSNYLLTLASLFNRYYQIHRIITEDTDLSAARIGLVGHLKEIFNKGLKLLGITPLEKM